MAQTLNSVFNGGKVIAGGQEVGNVTSCKLDLSYKELTAKAGYDQDPWLIENSGRDITGTVEFQSYSKEFIGQLIGGTQTASGSKWVKNETVTIAATVVPAEYSASTPVVSGSAIVTVNDGKLVYEQKESSPADGEFSYAGDGSTVSGFQFNAGDTYLGESAVVSYAVTTTGADQLRLLSSSVPDYVSLFLVNSARNLSSEVAGNIVLKMPKVKFTSLSTTFATDQVATFSANFRVAKDSNNVVLDISAESN